MTHEDAGECACGASNRRAFYSNITLYTEAGSGLPSGGGLPLAMTKILICTQCGKAEFTVPESDMRKFFGKT